MDRTKHEALLKEMCQLYIKLETQGSKLIGDLGNLNHTYHCEPFITKTIYNWLLEIVDHEINEDRPFDALPTPRPTSSKADPSLYAANYLASELGCSFKGDSTTLPSAYTSETQLLGRFMGSRGRNVSTLFYGTRSFNQRGI